MIKLAVVYHSGYGHTAKQAQAVTDGALTVPEVDVRLVKVGEINNHWDYVNAADAIIFGSPTYMGSLSAPFKAFMEATSKLWSEQKWQNKLAAGFTNSASLSGDKLNSLIQLAVFAAQHGMHWVNLGLLPGNNSSQSSPEDLNRLGSYLGAMAQSNSDQGPDVAPIPSDLKTAAHLGARVAQAAQLLQRGQRAAAKAA